MTQGKSHEKKTIENRHHEQLPTISDIFQHLRSLSSNPCYIDSRIPHRLEPDQQLWHRSLRLYQLFLQVKHGTSDALTTILNQVAKRVDMVFLQEIRLDEAEVYDLYCIGEIIGLSRSCYVMVDSLAALEVLVDSDTAWSGAATTYP